MMDLLGAGNPYVRGYAEGGFVMPADGIIKDTFGYRQNIADASRWQNQANAMKEAVAEIQAAKTPAQRAEVLGRFQLDSVDTLLNQINVYEDVAESRRLEAINQGISQGYGGAFQPSAEFQQLPRGLTARQENDFYRGLIQSRLDQIERQTGEPVRLAFPDVVQPFTAAIPEFPKPEELAREQVLVPTLPPAPAPAPETTPAPTPVPVPEATPVIPQPQIPVSSLPVVPQEGGMVPPSVIGGIPQPQIRVPSLYSGSLPTYQTPSMAAPVQQSVQQPQQQIQYGPIGQGAVGQTNLLSTLLSQQQDPTKVSLLGFDNPYLMKPFG